MIFVVYLLIFKGGLGQKLSIGAGDLDLSKYTLLSILNYDVGKNLNLADVISLSVGDNSYEEKIKDEAQGIADALKDIIVKVGAKVSSKGKIFGSVTTIQIAEAIKKAGCEVDRKCISIKEDAIKKVGTYTANIRLHREVIVDVKFEVVEE